MPKVQRSDIVDYQTYNDQRDGVRERMFAIKAPRRIHLGPHITFLFENRETVIYQVQEMMRVEQIVREADIQHEIETYNELVGGPGELGCTLLIEIDDPAERDVLLRAWLGLEKHLYLELEDGSRARARYDARQVGTDRISSVQYLVFDCRDVAPVAVGCDFTGYTHQAALTADQADALAADLA